MNKQIEQYINMCNLPLKCTRTKNVITMKAIPYLKKQLSVNEKVVKSLDWEQSTLLVLESSRIRGAINKVEGI